MDLEGKVLLVIGGGLMQLPLIEEARRLGCAVIVVDMDPEAPGLKIAEHPILISTRNWDSIIDYLKNKNIVPDGVLTVGTDMSYTVGKVVDEFGLFGISSSIAKYLTDKFLMRKKLRECGISVPDFVEVKSKDDLQRAKAFLKRFPLVVKPVDNMGARGVSLVSGIEELDRAYHEALKHSISGRVLVEEYIEGDEFSVDTLIYDSDIFFTGIADRIIGGHPYFIEFGHTMPSQKGLEVIKKVKAVMISIARCMGIKFGALKGDLIYSHKDKRVYVGEVAGRLSGGFMSGWTFPYSTGINLMKNVIYISFGYSPPDLKPRWERISIERSIIVKEGIVRSISGIEEALSIKTIKDIFIHKRVGDMIFRPRSNLDKFGNIIAVGDSLRQLELDIRNAKRRIKVGVSPLSDSNRQPPHYE